MELKALRKWPFRWGMLLYRGDKLQVSIVALGEHFKADCQLVQALSDCCTWPCTIHQISCNHQQSMHFTNEGKHNWRSPTHLAISSNDVCRKYLQPSIFSPSCKLFKYDDEWCCISRQLGHTHKLDLCIHLTHAAARNLDHFCTAVWFFFSVSVSRKQQGIHLWIIFVLVVPWKLCSC